MPNNGDFVDVILLYSRIVELVSFLQQLATDWTAWGSKPGGSEIFLTLPDLPWDPPILLYNGYWVIPGAKAAGAWP